jgi:3-hydroxyisobutyrate dehydrogenase-like beta-hydroxyacid dehydrogenase
VRHRSGARGCEACRCEEENGTRKKEEKEEMKSVGVIGLGIMGSAMSANLVKAGFTVHGYDVLAARRSALKRAGGRPAGSAAEVAARAPLVITSLPAADALHQVAAELETRCIVIETSTLQINDKLLARETLAKKKIEMLDCPLSGTGAQARTKDLAVYASGDKSAFSKITSVLEGFSRAHYYLGEFGNGSKMKYVANLLVAIHNVAAAEAFVLGMKAGLDPETIYKVVGDGAGTSRMFQVRGPQMVAGRYDDATMKVEVWQKDMKIIGEYATRLGVPTPLFNASAAVYTAAMAQGFGKQDTAAVCAVLEAFARLKR